MAIGVLEAVAASGRSVPADVAIVSCDDLPFAAHLVPGLTTVRLLLAETGAWAVSLLLQLAAGEDIGSAPVLLPVELVVERFDGPSASSAPRSGCPHASSNAHKPGRRRESDHAYRPRGTT